MVSSICKELILRKEEASNSQLQTIYFGGGTPSILSFEELKNILQTIYKNYDISPNAEVTLEANPDDFFRDSSSPTKLLSNLKQLGINRLSIGIQSFYEEDLRLMNRAHNATQAELLLLEAPKFFDNITIDLIYGIPNMTDERWQSNIHKALSFGVPHISAYALTIEPKTALHKFIALGKVPNVNEQQAHSHFVSMISILEKEGFIHYEFSNFGKEGYFSRNNTAYWFGKKYMGIGPSAHSFNGTERSWNIANNIKYIEQIQKGIIPAEKEILSQNDRYNELIITRIRTMIGISVEEVETTFGKKHSDYLLLQAKKHITNGLLSINNKHLVTTTKGKFLSDGIATDLFIVD
ncbi:putative oxygen-independent coproporphyrinogen III oxidase [Capnocytophaga cynodegmi]|uniref:Heme chaperone HemW n=2 Tax=Capnocytophaga cynodegmi TaxID=28189 RepID=A0A0B7HRA8_9FLAO|nr:putative oxygen-independent coproporphyrinogen III oxidase [Capnocytophaga cynodegmi]CEN42186.1 putative oxygen-independent coproporphyrinogen III oxidase [Capnocytophaga cynodegmi]